MNLNSLKIKNITRIIAHTVHSKTSTANAYAEHLTDLLDFHKEERNILIERLEASLTNSKKTFKVQYEDFSEESIHYALENSIPFSEKEFVAYSQALADKLAKAHFRTKIPGGYCLVGEGVTATNDSFFFIIKAELQEVFSITGNSLQVIKKVFLSPDKDFYKVGFFIKDSGKYIPFMFDDQYSPQKKDLTAYFYSQFLGLTTDRNDRLLSKNFFNDTKDFIENNYGNAKDRMGMLKALTVLYREETSGVISPLDFSEKYFENDLKKEFDKIVQSKYPHSFTKDISLIENKLDLSRLTIPLSYTLNITGDSSSIENIEIINDPDEETIKNLVPEINNGVIDKMVVLRVKKD